MIGLQGDERLVSFQILTQSFHIRIGQFLQFPYVQVIRQVDDLYVRGQRVRFHSFHEFLIGFFFRKFRHTA